jgi:hypothetical protein
MEKIHLSLENAQELIKCIKDDVLRLVALNKTLSLLNSVEIEFEDSFDTLSHEIKFNKKFHKLSYDFYSLLEDLHVKGCYVRDLNKGMVDFYSKFRGREIFLSWNVSDERIKYWYEIDSDYNARKPISMISSEIKSK